MDHQYKGLHLHSFQMEQRGDELLLMKFKGDYSIENWLPISMWGCIYVVFKWNREGMSCCLWSLRGDCLIEYWLPIRGDHWNTTDRALGGMRDQMNFVAQPKSSDPHLPPFQEIKKSNHQSQSEIFQPFLCLTQLNENLMHWSCKGHSMELLLSIGLGPFPLNGLIALSFTKTNHYDTLLWRESYKEWCILLNTKTHLTSMLKRDLNPICDLLFATNRLSCPSHLSNKSVVFGDYRAELSTPITLRVQAVAMPLI